MNLSSLSYNSYSTTSPIVLGQRILYHVLAMRNEVSITLTKPQVRYKQFVDKVVQTRIPLTVRQHVYVNGSATTLCS